MEAMDVEDCDVIYIKTQKESMDSSETVEGDISVVVNSLCNNVEKETFDSNNFSSAEESKLITESSLNVHTDANQMCHKFEEEVKSLVNYLIDRSCLNGVSSIVNLKEVDATSDSNPQFDNLEIDQETIAKSTCEIIKHLEDSTSLSNHSVNDAITITNFKDCFKPKLFSEVGDFVESDEEKLSVEKEESLDETEDSSNALKSNRISKRKLMHSSDENDSLQPSSAKRLILSHSDEVSSLIPKDEFSSNSPKPSLRNSIEEITESVALENSLSPQVKEPSSENGDKSLENENKIYESIAEDDSLKEKIESSSETNIENSSLEANNWKPFENENNCLISRAKKILPQDTQKDNKEEEISQNDTGNTVLPEDKLENSDEVTLADVEIKSPEVNVEDSPSKIEDIATVEAPSEDSNNRDVISIDSENENDIPNNDDDDSMDIENNSSTLKKLLSKPLKSSGSGDNSQPEKNEDIEKSCRAVIDTLSSTVNGISQDTSNEMDNGDINDNMSLSDDISCELNKQNCNDIKPELSSIEESESSSDVLSIDFKTNTITMPLETFLSLCYNEPDIKNNTPQTDNLNPKELLKLLDEERQKGKLTRNALRAVYLQQRSLYRASGYPLKLDTRTVGVMTRISDDSDYVVRENICDVQISSGASPTTISSTDSIVKDTLSEIAPLLRNTSVTVTPSNGQESHLLSDNSSNKHSFIKEEIKPNKIDFKKSGEQATQNSGQDALNNGNLVGSPPIVIPKELSISTKTTSETTTKQPVSTSTVPQIIDLTDDDDPPPTKPEKTGKDSTESTVSSLVNSNNIKPVFFPSSVQIIPSSNSSNTSMPNNNVQLIRNSGSSSVYFVSPQSSLIPVGTTRPSFGTSTPSGISNMVIFRPVGLNIPTTQSGVQKGVTKPGEIQQYVSRTGQPRAMTRPNFVQTVQPPSTTISKSFGASGSQITLTPRFNKHPAPLPQPPAYPTNRSLKALPPKPCLKMSKTSSGVSLSWSMTLHNNHADISAYQLYAYQESSGRVDSSLWKKVSDIKAMPLPMACTLTQFVDGHKYHFAMRAVDVHRRVGQFSDPITVHHTVKGSPNK